MTGLLALTPGPIGPFQIQHWSVSSDVWFICGGGNTHSHTQSLVGTKQTNSGPLENGGPCPPVSEGPFGLL